MNTLGRPGTRAAIASLVLLGTLGLASACGSAVAEAPDAGTPAPQTHTRVPVSPDAHERRLAGSAGHIPTSADAAERRGAAR